MNPYRARSPKYTMGFMFAPKYCKLVAANAATTGSNSVKHIAVKLC